ncbi:glycoside hydrolase family 3 protein [Cellulomonas sp. URHD0024]|uniref:glycoside hydrolase family 3 protein n=1 Tax=Cellulomonas sp. URHD0024 TaxID=1302620 RepID=UPI000409953A|nr:glycoside hydrolase family 3 protein [Cellulomonas sp. URHD0024]
MGTPELDSDGTARIPETLPTYSDWPEVRSSVPRDEAVESRVAALLATMSVAEKVGQITQPEIRSITPDEVRAFHIGSVLNGGGAWPGDDKHASLQGWLDLADAFWEASVHGNAAARIPVLWGSDAVHGHANTYGATVFPHNIGLGAAREPELVRRISAATARQIRATGQDWAFAPTVAVPQNYRWGRNYEGFSEDASIVLAYGYEAVRGLQGDSLPDPVGSSVLACAKHYIGDGATDGGVDQGVATVSEDVLRNVHGQGYISALAAGVQTVMASFNSWNGPDAPEGKVHGSYRLLTGILKEAMGFDGLVVSDWNGVGQVEGCADDRAAQAINAGIDMVMVPEDWRSFIANTLKQVESGEIPMSRLDDAVTRILRVKIRSGVMDAPKPSRRPFAGDVSALVHTHLAREAVRKSLVLLKNRVNVLPLAPSARVLVVGKSADSVQNQTGGWTLTWQGNENSNADFPASSTVLTGLRDALGDSSVVFDETGESANPADFDAVIAVLGEIPYAEGFGGDLGDHSLDASLLYPEDLAVLDRVSGLGAPVITVYISGRPLWVNSEINRSDAFVAAWLPGTEGAGIVDLLVQGDNRHDFTGRLPNSWPRSPWQFELNAGHAGYDPLFPLGYGLSLHDSIDVALLDEAAPPRPHDTLSPARVTDTSPFRNLA